FLLGQEDVKAVTRFKNLRVDGALVLSNDRRLAVEIKLRMNWEKACQAEYEFRQFLKLPEAKTDPVIGGIVFFEEFSGDWKTHAKSRQLEDGWSHWYRGHSKVDGLPSHLARIRDE